jgi:phage repressor protein C with HTH and peptisase S24 domain
MYATKCSAMSIPIVSNDDLLPLPDISAEEVEAMEPHERLRAVREKHYETAADAARAMGIEAGTYRAHEEGRGTLRHLTRYAKFFNVSLDFLATGKLPSKSTSEHKHAPVVDATSEGLAVKGFVQAGVWQESYAPDDAQNLPIVGVSGYPLHRQFALQIKGDSINRRAKDGSYAICVEWHGPLANGDVVVFERRRNGFFQATIKIIKLRDTMVELWPDSDNPQHQEPLAVSGKELREGEEVAVVAKVIGFYSNT